METVNLSSTRTSTTTRVAIIGMLLMGTGSAFAVERAAQWRDYVQPRVPFPVEVITEGRRKEDKLELRIAIEHLQNIRSVLKPSIADLANLFEVSRQAVYKWLSSESTPEPANMSRILTLSQIADALQSAKVPRTETLLKMKIRDGKSLLDIFKAGEDCTPIVHQLIDEAKRMDSAYQLSSVSASTAPATDEWKASLSIPGAHEER
ncbi:MAG: transcriptional regulator [Herminiimonas sp.]|nr:transcriptional regulator [Herminiimonas sp.]